MSKVRQAINQVRDAVAKASMGLDYSEYTEFLNELIADAAGWEMELDEREAERESDSL